MGIELINGLQGPYDGKVNNSSVRYGRNAIANYNEYIKSIKVAPLSQDILDLKGPQKIKEMSLEELDRITLDLENSLNGQKIHNMDFNLKYLPEEKVDYKVLNTIALLGAAFEELGRKVSVSVQSLTEQIQKACGENFNAEFLDINKDSQIDIGEYSTSILMSDMLSKNPSVLEAGNITGEITNLGENMLLAYSNRKNYNAASEDAKDIYEAFHLAGAQEEFLADPDNLIQ